MKKMKLLDRIILPTVLPQEGNLITIRIVKDILKKVELSQDDFVKYGILPGEKGGLYWEAKHNEVDFEYDFTDLEVSEIVKGLKKLDSENKLTKDMLGLADIFLK